MEDEKGKYDLTEEEFKSCLGKAEIAIFINSSPSKKPVSVFIVSQPGSGKTGLKTYIQGKYQNHKFIEFDPDTVAIHHKYYREIITEYPNESHKELQKFVMPALDDYLRYRAVQFRNNIMQEGTFANTNGYLNMLKVQKYGGKAPIDITDKDGVKRGINVNGNYYIDINILAVHRFESLLSAYEREQYFIEHELPARAVTKENHDKAYTNMLKTIREVEKRGLYNKMGVYVRGYLEENPQLIYEQEVGGKESCIETILKAREENKCRIMRHPTEYLERIEELRGRIKNNKDNSNIQLKKLEELEEEFKAELKEYKKGENFKNIEDR